MDTQRHRLYRTPLFIAMGVFLTCMLVIWVLDSANLDSTILVVGVSYAVICFLFLVFQLVAFIRAHLSYDEDIENVKFKVLEIEKKDDLAGPGPWAGGMGCFYCNVDSTQLKTFVILVIGGLALSGLLMGIGLWLRGAFRNTEELGPRPIECEGETQHE